MAKLIRRMDPRMKDQPYPLLHSKGDNKCSRGTLKRVMERLFRPCDRLRGSIPDGFTENALNVDLSTFHQEPSQAESYAPFIHFLGNSILWISKRVFLVGRGADRALNADSEFRQTSSSSPQLNMTFRTSSFHRSSRGSASITVWLQNVDEDQESVEEINESMREMVDSMLHLMRQWKCTCVRIQVIRSDRTLHASEAALSRLLVGPYIRELELVNVDLLGEQCRALGQLQNDHLKLTLWDVTMRDMASFNSGLSRNLGPRNIEVWTMATSSGLEMLAFFARNTRLKGLVCGGAAALQSENIDLIIAALAANQGLEHLCLSCSISSDAWTALWEAIALHPHLRHADIRNSSSDIETTCIREYTRVVGRCMETNQILQKIDVSSRHRDATVWRQLVLPALETNIYRPRFKSINRLDSHDSRDAVLAKALASVQNKPYLLYLALNAGITNMNQDTYS